MAPPKAPAQVLIVDDNEVTCRLLEKLFQGLGACPTLVKSGDEGIAKVSEMVKLGTSFDLVIMDIRMPGIDGNTAAKAMRNQGFKGSLVAMTGTVTVGGRKNSKTAGFDTYLDKQVVTKDLLKVLLDQIPAKT